MNNLDLLWLTRFIKIDYVVSAWQNISVWQMRKKKSTCSGSLQLDSTSYMGTTMGTSRDHVSAIVTLKCTRMKDDMFDGCLAAGVKLKEYQSMTKFTKSSSFTFVFRWFYFGYYDIKHLSFFILLVILVIPRLQAGHTIIWVARHHKNKDGRIR